MERLGPTNLAADDSINNLECQRTNKRTYALEDFALNANSPDIWQEIVLRGIQQDQHI
jgi:hypothetical protein